MRRSIRDLAWRIGLCGLLSGLGCQGGSGPRSPEAEATSSHADSGGVIGPTSDRDAGAPANSSDPDQPGQGGVSGAAQDAGTEADLFAPVFALMNQPGRQGGCVGCHIASAPVSSIPYFGSTMEGVLKQLKMRGLARCGLDSRLARRISSRGPDRMPPPYLGGPAWSEDQAAVLDRWLTSIDDCHAPDAGRPVDRDAGAPGQDAASAARDAVGADVATASADAGTGADATTRADAQSARSDAAAPDASSIGSLDASTPDPTSDPFSAVFAFMNNPPAQGGCVGCHIAPEPVGTYPYFGKDQSSVLATFRMSGIVAGGRQSRLSDRLKSVGIDRMPPSWADAPHWTTDQLAVLDNWLRAFDETSPPPQLDRYQLVSAVITLTGQPGLASYLLDEPELFDRFPRNWPVGPPSEYSALSLVSLEAVAGRACSDDPTVMETVTGLPGGAATSDADVNRALTRMSIRFLGLQPSEAGIDLLRIYNTALSEPSSSSPHAFAAVCYTLIRHPLFTE